MSQTKPQDINMLRAKLRKTLDSIGRSNGHQCPATQSNADPVLHELYVTSEASSYFKLRHDKAREEALRMAFDPGELDALTARVVKSQQGENLIPVEGDVYSMTMSISRPATKVDVVALQNYLITKHGMSREDVDKAVTACTKYSTPARHVKVVSR